MSTIGEQALGYLTQSVSVDLVGRPGSGRSHAVNHVTEGLAHRDIRPVRLAGVGALKAVPLGAMLISFPELAKQPSLADAISFLSAEASRAGVIVVDDADDLDQATLGVLGGIRSRLKTPTLLTRRVAHLPAGGLGALVAGMLPGIHLDMLPLRYRDLQSLLRDTLKGPMEPKTLARITTHSGGLPGIARGISIVGRATGAIRNDGRFWASNGPLWSTELSVMVEALLIDCDKDDRSALELLAHAGTVSVSDARRVIPSERLDRLASLGFLDYIDGQSGGSVGLYPPIIVSYFVSEATAPERYAIRERLITEGMNLPPMLSSGLHPPAPVDTTLLSRTMEDHWESATYARLQAWEADPSPANAATLTVAALSSATNVVDPTEVYHRTDLSQGPEGASAEFATWYAVYLSIMRNDAVGAHNVLDNAVDQCPNAKTFIESMHGHIRLLLDGVPPAIEPPTFGELPISTIGYLSTKAEVCLATGDILEASAALGSTPPAHVAFTPNWRFSKALALVLGGDFMAGTRMALDALEDAKTNRMPGTVHALSYIAGLGLLVQGQIDRAEQVIQSALTMTAISGLLAHYFSGLQGLQSLIGHLSGSYRESGDDDRERVAAQYERGPYPYMSGGLQTITSDPTHAWDAVEDVTRRGYATSAAFRSVDAAEIHPDAAVFQTYRESLPTPTSPFLKALFALAEAIVRGDLDALGVVEGELEALGAWLYVARAGVARAVMLRARGDRDAATLAADACWEKIAGAGLTIRGVYTPLTRSIDLSQRELEVIHLVVDGQTPSEIAASLVLSVRTVEHHLSSAYKKIGIDSRDRLRKAFTTWLAPS